MAAMLDGSGGAAQAGWATRPARTTTSASTMMRATRPIASPSCPSLGDRLVRPTGRHGPAAVTEPFPGTGDSCPSVAAMGLPTPATLVPPAGPIVVLDLDLLLADLGGHPLLAGHGVLVEPDPLPGHDPLLDHRLLLAQDHLMFGLGELRPRGGGSQVGVGDRLALDPHPLPPHGDGLLDLLGGDVLAQPDPTPLALGGADPQLLFRAGHGVIGPRPRGVPPPRTTAGGAPPGGAVIVEAVVAPQLALLGLGQVLVGVDSWGV